MNKHHRIGKHIRGESPVWRQQHKAAGNVFFRGLARALIEEGLELTVAEPEVDETPAEEPAQATGAVWIVSRGEKHEGSSVLRVFHERSDALAFAGATQKEIGGCWIPFAQYGSDERAEDLFSENDGCDYVTVKRRGVY